MSHTTPVQLSARHAEIVELSFAWSSDFYSRSVAMLPCYHGTPYPAGTTDAAIPAGIRLWLLSKLTARLRPDRCCRPACCGAPPESAAPSLHAVPHPPACSSLGMLLHFMCGRRL